MPRSADQLVTDIIKDVLDDYERRGQPVPLTALIMRALPSVVETSPALVEDLAKEALHARLLAAVEARKLAAPEGEVSGIHPKFPSKLN